MPSSVASGPNGAIEDAFDDAAATGLVPTCGDCAKETAGISLNPNGTRRAMKQAAEVCLKSEERVSWQCHSPTLRARASASCL